MSIRLYILHMMCIDTICVSGVQKEDVRYLPTRPCVNSASRYFLSVSSSAFSANPRGSNNPVGAMAPGMESMVKRSTGLGAAAFFPKAKALIAVDVLATGAGTNAAAEPARAEAMMSFIIDGSVCR